MAMAMAMAAAALAPAMGRCVDGSGACASGRPAAGPRPLARGASHADVGRWAERGRGRAVRATRTLAVAAAVGSGRDVVADARTNFRLLIGEAEGGREVPLFMRNRYFETLSGEIRVALGEEEIMIAAQKGARALAEAKQKQAEIERAVSALKRVVLAGSPTGATGEVEGEGGRPRGGGPRGVGAGQRRVGADYRRAGRDGRRRVDRLDQARRGRRQ